MKVFIVFFVTIFLFADGFNAALVGEWCPDFCQTAELETDNDKSDKSGTIASDDQVTLANTAVFFTHQKNNSKYARATLPRYSRYPGVFVPPPRVV